MGKHHLDRFDGGYFLFPFNPPAEEAAEGTGADDCSLFRLPLESLFSDMSLGHSQIIT